MRIHALAAGTALLFAASCATRPVPPLIDLHSVSEIEAAFDADIGKPRLVLLLSPT